MSNPEPLALDLDKVTGRMLVDFKEQTGTSLMSLVEDGEITLDDMDEKVLVGVIWIAKRCSGNPDATWDDALDTPLMSLDLTGGGDEADPTNASSDN